ncbi:MAG: DUF5597 domain-containing protein [Dysgonamonadaceae bacterium]|jgi:hypothetical protein|nr:DUF5597 domain-containing protein [Dysgonamonadaceae bacterium]
MHKKIIVFVSLIFVLIASNAQSKRDLPYIQPKGDAWQFFIDGKPTVLLAGELHNSTASSMEFMNINNMWATLKNMNLNAVIAPIYWELLEPEEGRFDFTTLDELIAEARKHNMKLVLIWFGSWKNTVSSYAPVWVRRNLKRFPRAKNPKGENMNALSCFSEENRNTDAKAFAKVMKHIKEIDETQQTVVCVQVQNESGIRTCPRDYNSLANKKFKEQVPAALISYLEKNKKNLIPELDSIWKKSSYRTSGTWSDIFKNDADELFMAWYIAGYIDKVAEAGKKEYKLPMFTNAWLDDPDYQFSVPGEYPSGGPIAKTVPLYKAAAPSLDFLSPDIYRKDFENVCRLYKRMDNALFIPESPRTRIMVANAFYSVGEGALGFAPYGIEYLPDPKDTLALGEAYATLSALMPEITQYQGTGRMKGVRVLSGKTQTIDLGNYLLHITAESGRKIPAYGLIIAKEDDEYLAAGNGFTVTFTSKANKKLHAEMLWIQELAYVNGQWKKLRHLNGGQAGRGSVHYTKLHLVDETIQRERNDYPIILHTKLFTYE